MQTFVIQAESLTAQAELASIGAGAEYEGVRMLAKGDIWVCFVACLTELTLDQLNNPAFERHVRHAKNMAGVREAAERAKEIVRRLGTEHLERVAAEASAEEWGPADVVELTGLAPPKPGEFAAFGTDVLDDDEDEDTPLEPIEPHHTQGEQP